MNTNRLWIFGTVLVSIALIAGTWFIGVSPRLAESAAANADRAVVVAQNSTHAITLASLKEQFEHLDELEETLDGLRAAVPSDAATSVLFEQLTGMATAAGVTIAEVTMDAPERYAAPAVPPTDAELATATGSVNPENFVAIPITVTIQGGYAEAMNFLSAAQTGERLFLVHDLVLTPGAAEYRLSGQIFALLDVAAPVAPAPGAPGSDAVAGAPAAQ